MPAVSKKIHVVSYLPSHLLSRHAAVILLNNKRWELLKVILLLLSEPK